MISVIIPTLNGERYIPNLEDILKRQKFIKNQPQEIEIIIIDSESDDNTVRLAREAGWKVIPIKRSEFDHGGTRNKAWQQAKGDIICFLTQDALPCDENYLDELIDEFNDPQVVMISGRQVPKPDANPVEALTRAFNYPRDSFVRSKKDIDTMGIKAYFFSDACSAYRRDFLEEMGGFEEPILTNEDMLMAANALEHDYKVGYCGSAKVYHSHNFSLSYQYRRNFDVAVFMKQHESQIKGAGTTKEGIRMVLYTIKELLIHLHLLSVFRCCFESLAKFLGNRAGRRYESMSKKTILKKTTNKAYWEKIIHDQT